jgi:hypothetical protein
MFKIVNVLAFIFLFTACDGITISDGEVIHNEVLFKIDIKDRKIENIEDLKANFTVTNQSSDEVVFGFSSGCQSAFVLKQDGQTLVDSRQFYFCTQALTSFSLAPGEMRTFGVHLDMVGSYMQEELDKIKEGNYHLEVFLRDNQSPKLSGSFTIE